MSNVEFNAPSWMDILRQPYEEKSRNTVLFLSLSLARLSIWREIEDLTTAEDLTKVDEGAAKAIQMEKQDFLAVTSLDLPIRWAEGG